MVEIPKWNPSTTILDLLHPLPPPFLSFIHPSLSLHRRHHHYLPHHQLNTPCPLFLLYLPHYPHASKPPSPPHPCHVTKQSSTLQEETSFLFSSLLHTTHHPPTHTKHPLPPLFQNHLPLPVHLLLISFPPLLLMSPILPLPLSLRPPCLLPTPRQTQNLPLPLLLPLHPSLLVSNVCHSLSCSVPTSPPPSRQTQNLPLPLPFLLSPYPSLLVPNHLL